MAVITQICHSQIVFDGTATHGTKYEENQSSHHKGMLDDGLDLFLYSQFCYYGAGDNYNIGKAYLPYSECSLFVTWVSTVHVAEVLLQLHHESEQLIIFSRFPFSPTLHCRAHQVFIPAGYNSSHL